MKNEIKLYKIGETYIKFNFEYSEVNKLKIKEAYLSQIGITSRECLKNDQVYKISIEFEKGSLKTNIRIWCTSIFLFTVGYGSFKTGLKEIVSDVRQVSEAVVNGFYSSPNITQNNIIRTERRLGLPGRLHELYKRIDSYERNINNLSNAQQQVELTAIKTEIANLIELLSEQDKQAFLNEINNNYTQNLPQPNQRRIKYLINKYALQPENKVEFIEEI